MERELDVRGAPHFGLEALHYACPFCRPEETNHSSFYLYDLFNSIGCDEGDGDATEDDSFLVPGIELPDDEPVFTGDPSDFFDQGDTEVVADETNSLSETRPDEAVRSEIKRDGDGGMMESAISEYIEDGLGGTPVANAGIDAGVKVHPGQDAGPVAGGKGEDPYVSGVRVCNEVRELARAAQDKGSIGEPSDEGRDGDLHIVCRRDSKAVDKFGDSLQDEVQSCKHKGGLDPSPKARREAGSRGGGEVHERRRSAVSSGGTSVSRLTPHFIGSVCQN